MLSETANRNSLIKSLFNGLEHLGYAFVGLRGENGFGYEMGDSEFREIMEEPPDIGDCRTRI